MTTSRVETTSHTKEYELTDFARYSLIWFSDLGRISSVGLAQAFMVATLILSLRLRITEAGHLAVFHQNLSGAKAVPLQYIIYIFICVVGGYVYHVRPVSIRQHHSDLARLDYYS